MACSAGRSSAGKIGSDSALRTSLEAVCFGPRTVLEGAGAYAEPVSAGLKAAGAHARGRDLWDGRGCPRLSVDGTRHAGFKLLWVHGWKYWVDTRAGGGRG